MPEQPRVSVVIPVHDDPDGLLACLDHLRRQDYPHHLLEVLVVDNASTTPVAAAIERARFDADGITLCVLSEPTPGSYAARNAGVAVATGEVIAFTDADCLPRPDWVSEAVGQVGDPTVGELAGRVEVVTRPPGSRSGAEVYDLVHGFPQRYYVENLRFGVTANVVTRRDVLDAVGPFAAVRSGGDRDWGQRVAAAGYRVVYAPAAVVEHPARRTLSEICGKARRTRRGHAELLARAGTPMDRGAVLRRFVPPSRSVVSALTRPGLTRAEAVRYAGALVAMHYTVAVADARGRRARPAGRTVPRRPAAQP